MIRRTAVLTSWKHTVRDRKENRKDGKQTMKRTVTARRTSAEDPSCPFESQYTVMTAVILSEGAMGVPIISIT